MTELHVATSNPNSLYTCVFPKKEYGTRLGNARTLMMSLGYDALLIASPQNMNYFTGFDGWSFYTPQFLVILPDREFIVIRAMDAAAGHTTTYLEPNDILEYSEHLVDNLEKHPLELVYHEMGAVSKLGVEMDATHFRGRYLLELQKIHHGEMVDAMYDINCLRMIKSDAELEFIRRASRIADNAMSTAISTISEDTSGADVAASATSVQHRYGSYVSIAPMVMVNERGAHMNWTADKFRQDDTIALELSGAFHHYHCPIARTVYLGTPPSKMRHIEQAVLVSMAAALRVIRDGAICADVYQTFEAHMNHYGLSKKSRVGYSFGLGFPPDWGENTFSIRPNDETVLRKNMCIHLIAGCGDEWGFQVSEALIVQANGPELLCRTPRCLFRSGEVGRTHATYRPILTEFLHERLDIVDNPRRTTEVNEIVSTMHAMPRERPHVKATDLVLLDNNLGLKQIFVKNESQRMGLNSFKALGVSYAVEKLFAAGKIHKGDTLTTMTDGNHGKGLAHVAKHYGCECFVFVPENMVEARKQAIADLGATVEVVKGDYDAAVAYSNEQARVNNWHFISDQSLENYREIPLDIMTGYMTLFYECEHQMGIPANELTHVFIQVGVGGLAGAAAAWMSSFPHVKLILVEPDDADCLFVSIEYGRLTESTKNIDSIMAGLNCGTPSIASLPLLYDRTDHSITVSDVWAERACRMLARQQIVAGESGGAGLAGLLACMDNDTVRNHLKLDANSKVLLINSEGDTDPANYARILKKIDADFML